jgi:hypothetical protein
MKRFWALILAMICTAALTGCQKYRDTDMIGKTSAQILEQYGAFDCVGMPADADGLYRNTCCGYTIKESRAGLLGTDPEVLFFIHFDENGIAVECEEGYRPGG